MINWNVVSGQLNSGESSLPDDPGHCVGFVQLHTSCVDTTQRHCLRLRRHRHDWHRKYHMFLQADSQLKSGGLVWGSAATWRCSTFITWTELTLQWPCDHDDSTINIALGIIIIITAMTTWPALRVWVLVARLWQEWHWASQGIALWQSLYILTLGKLAYLRVIFGTLGLLNNAMKVVGSVFSFLYIYISPVLLLSDSEVTPFGRQFTCWCSV